MNKKQSIFFLLTILTCILSSCKDYTYENEYIIDNKLNIAIRVVYTEPYCESTIRTETIPSLTVKTISVQSARCEKNYTPQKFDVALAFKNLDIFYNDTVKINKNFLESAMWTFSSEKYAGEYTLVFNSSLF